MFWPRGRDDLLFHIAGQTPLITSAKRDHNSTICAQADLTQSTHSIHCVVRADNTATPSNGRPSLFVHRCPNMWDTRSSSRCLVHPSTHTCWSGDLNCLYQMFLYHFLYLKQKPRQGGGAASTPPRIPPYTHIK